MDPNLNTRSEIFPVSQEVPEGTEMDLWEPPFERWLRLADSLLGNVPPTRLGVPIKN